MSAGAFSDKGVAEAAAGLIPVKADPVSARDVFMRYNVRSTPTVLFLDADGQVIDQLRQRDTASVKRQIHEVVARRS